jgi:hypothetical protein
VVAPTGGLAGLAGLARLADGFHNLPGLRQLCLRVPSRGPPLHPSKWPFVLVLVDEVPRGPTGKVSRIRLAEGLRLPEVREATPEMDRTFIARFGAGSYPPEQESSWVLTPAREDPTWLAAAAAAADADAEAAANAKNATANANVEIDATPRDGGVHYGSQTVRRGGGGGGGGGGLSPTQTRIASVWSDVLGVETESLTPRSDFFVVGGSSLTAGRVAGVIRDVFGVSLTVGLYTLNSVDP